MAMPFRDKTHWGNSLNPFHQVNSKFTHSIANLYMVCSMKCLEWVSQLISSRLKLKLAVSKIIFSFLSLSFLCFQTEQATQGQTTLLVVTAGSVKFDGNKQRYFNQNFLLTAQASPNSDQPVWKIASDCFRFQDWANWSFCIVSDLFLIQSVNKVVFFG